jgi:hypothetical protein
MPTPKEMPFRRFHGEYNPETGHVIIRDQFKPAADYHPWGGVIDDNSESVLRPRLERNLVTHTLGIPTYLLGFSAASVDALDSVVKRRWIRAITSTTLAVGAALRARHSWQEVPNTNQKFEELDINAPLPGNTRP